MAKAKRKTRVAYYGFKMAETNLCKTRGCSKGAANLYFQNYTENNEKLIKKSYNINLDIISRQNGARGTVHSPNPEIGDL